MVAFRTLWQTVIIQPSIKVFSKKYICHKCIFGKIHYFVEEPIQNRWIHFCGYVFLGIISFFMSSLLRFYRLNNCEKNVLAGAWREFGAMKNPLCFCEDKNCVTCQSFFTPYSTWSKSLEMLFRKLPSLKHANNQSCTAKLLMTGLGRENSNFFKLKLKH